MENLENVTKIISRMRDLTSGQESRAFGQLQVYKGVRLHTINCISPRKHVIYSVIYSRTGQKKNKYHKSSIVSHFTVMQTVKLGNLRTEGRFTESNAGARLC